MRRWVFAVVQVISNPRRLALALPTALLAALVCLAPPRGESSKPDRAVDPRGATEANARGIGHLDQYDFGEAAKEFGDAVRIAW